MRAEDKVLKKYPRAIIEKVNDGFICLSGMGKIVYGEGKTEGEAWSDAHKNIVGKNTLRDPLLRINKAHLNRVLKAKALDDEMKVRMTKGHKLDWKRFCSKKSGYDMSKLTVKLQEMVMNGEIKV